MAKKKRNTTAVSDAGGSKRRPKSTAFFGRGIKNDLDFINTSLAVAGDLISQNITATIGNAVGGQMRNVLKMVELRYRYGQSPTEGAPKVLQLA